jgi:ABC-type lipoprotein release transport system permease subunit
MGVGAARPAAGVLTGLLYGVPATDAASFVACAAGLALVALAACVIPARRALRADPVTLLR